MVKEVLCKRREIHSPFLYFFFFSITFDFPRFIEYSRSDNLMGYKIAQLTQRGGSLSYIF